MSYRSDRFNNGMRSVEEMTAGFSDPSKAKVFSDGGAGVGRMLDEIDGEAELSWPGRPRPGEEGPKEEKAGRESCRLRNATACQGWTADGVRSGVNGQECPFSERQTDKSVRSPKDKRTGVSVLRKTNGQECPFSEDDERAEALFAAEMRLADAGKSYLIRVLLLIVENGADREISLEYVSRRTYFRHRDELMKFFHSSGHAGA